MTEHARVAIIGAGPAGLTAAAALAGTLNGRVVVLEREAEFGGIPRHSDHLGFGLRDLRRFASGPAYARELTARALDAGAELESSAMVTGWHAERTLEVTSPAGRRLIHADAVILATGARERPRSARLVPGDRPSGVLTTGQLQNAVHLHRQPIGKRAVVIGAELVSWSAVWTLRQAGCQVVMVTSEYEQPESYAAVRLAGTVGLQVPVSTQTKVARINGKDRVESVELVRTRSGQRRTIECDTVVFTGDWIPDHELARSAGLRMDYGTLGPTVDAALATSRPGIFAVGNLVHPVETADVAALDGRHVATAVRTFLSGANASRDGVDLIVDAPLRWVAPQVLRPGLVPARGRLLLWSDEFRRFPQLRAHQDGRLLNSVILPRTLAPGRVNRAPFGLVSGANPRGGSVTISLSPGARSR